MKLSFVKGIHRISHGPAQHHQNVFLHGLVGIRARFIERGARGPERIAGVDSHGLQNRFFEAPSHLAGKRIEVRFDPLDLTQLEIYSEGKPHGVARPNDCCVPHAADVRHEARRTAPGAGALPET